MTKAFRIDCSKDVPITQQSAKDECDINLIVERAKRGADLSSMAKQSPMFGDFRDFPDYRSALLLVKKANDAFMSMDAFVRERFGNDPARMLDFLKDPRNTEEAIKLGLVLPPPVAEPPPVPAKVAEGKAKPKADRDD